MVYTVPSESVSIGGDIRKAKAENFSKVLHSKE